MADPEDGRMNGEHLDEGVVHAWLDGQLSGPDAARIEAHIAGCAACAAIVAEARGFIAASSRILTGLDGVPARVVPRSRTRTRVWQVRAAAAVLIVALGAAAVLRDAGGRLDQIRGESAVSRQPRAASPAAALAKAADSESAASAAPSPPPAASPAHATPRSAVPAPAQRAPQVPQQMPQQEQQQMLQPKQLQDQQRDNKKAAALDDARQRSVAAGAGYLGGQSVAPVPRDTPPAAPPSAMTSAFAAKAAPSSVGGNRPQQPASADSTVSAKVAEAFSVRRLASNAAYRRCAGQVVTVSQSAGASARESAGAPAHPMTVRLDSAPQSAPARGFVIAATDGQGNLGGWWMPVGADSAVVALTNPGAAAGVPMADSVSAGIGGAIPVTVTRVRCESP